MQLITHPPRKPFGSMIVLFWTLLCFCNVAWMLWKKVLNSTEPSCTQCKTWCLFYQSQNILPLIYENMIGTCWRQLEVSSMLGAVLRWADGRDGSSCKEVRLVFAQTHEAWPCYCANHSLHGWSWSACRFLQLTFSCLWPVWGRGTPLPPCPFSSSSSPPFTFPFLSLALPIFFFCPSLPFLPE